MPTWTAEQEVEAVKQQLPEAAWKQGASLARCVEDLRMDRDLYRGALVGLLPVCDAEPGELAERIKRFINQALRAEGSAVLRRPTPPQESEAEQNFRHYVRYLKEATERGDENVIVSARYVRAMDATCREFSELDEAMGVPHEGSDEEAQAFRLEFVRKAVEAGSPARRPAPRSEIYWRIIYLMQL